MRKFYADAINERRKMLFNALYTAICYYIEEDEETAENLALFCEGHTLRDITPVFDDNGHLSKGTTIFHEWEEDGETYSKEEKLDKLPVFLLDAVYCYLSTK